MAGVQRAPSAAEINLESDAEVHRRVDGRDTDVPEVSRAVASGNVDAPAERHRQMRETATDTPAFGVGLRGGPPLTRV